MEESFDYISTLDQFDAAEKGDDVRAA